MRYYQRPPGDEPPALWVVLFFVVSLVALATYATTYEEPEAPCTPVADDPGFD